MSKTQTKNTVSPGKDLHDRFLEAMSRTATTVSVVTTDGPGGRAGATVSAMSSVSADTPKPTMLVCIHHKSATATAILRNDVFCINVLRDEQSTISDIFAGREGQPDKFSGLRCIAGSTGAPRLPDSLVVFDCRLAHAERVGTHFVLFAAVEDIAIADAGAPLIYANRTYLRPALVQEEGRR